MEKEIERVKESFYEQWSLVDWWNGKAPCFFPNTEVRSLVYIGTELEETALGSLPCAVLKLIKFYAKCLMKLAEVIDFSLGQGKSPDTLTQTGERVMKRWGKRGNTVVKFMTKKIRSNEQIKLTKQKQTHRYTWVDSCQRGGGLGGWVKKAKGSTTATTTKQQQQA